MIKNIKQILSYGFFCLLLFTGLFAWFFFWASSPNWQASDYKKTVSLIDAPPAAVADTFTILTYNIGYLSGMRNNTVSVLSQQFVQGNQQKVVHLLRQLQPDYLAMQEVDFYAQRSHYQDQGAALSKGGGFVAYANAVSWDKRYLPFPYSLRGHFGRLVSGQTLASQTPIVDHQRYVLDKVASQPAYYQAFYLDRLIQIVVTHRNTKRLAIMNVHLDHSDTPTRRKQTQKVLENFKSLEQKFDAVLLVGDFNSYLHAPKERDPTIRVMLSDTTRLCSAVKPSAYHQRHHFTFDAQNPYEKIDYIFYNPQKLRCLSAQRIDLSATASDHLPIYAQFEFIQ